jgi:hypothetical protein
MVLNCHIFPSVQAWWNTLRCTKSDGAEWKRWCGFMRKLGNPTESVTGTRKEVLVLSGGFLYIHNFVKKYWRLHKEGIRIVTGDRRRQTPRPRISTRLSGPRRDCLLSVVPTTEARSRIKRDFDSPYMDARNSSSLRMSRDVKAEFWLLNPNSATSTATKNLTVHLTYLCELLVEALQLRRIWSNYLGRCGGFSSAEESERYWQKNRGVEAPGVERKRWAY